MRLLSALMALLLAYAVVVQLNDPDALIWMVAYGVLVGLSVAAATGRYYVRVTAVAGIVYTLAALGYLPALRYFSLDALGSMGMRDLEAERVREGLGLWICALWAAGLWWAGRRVSSVSA